MKLIDYTFLDKVKGLRRRKKRQRKNCIDLVSYSEQDRSLSLDSPPDTKRLYKMADDSPNKSNKLLQLPLTRIKMIMRSSPDLGNVSTEGYFLIARAAVSILANDIPIDCTRSLSLCTPQVAGLVLFVNGKYGNCTPKF